MSLPGSIITVSHEFLAGILAQTDPAGPVRLITGDESPTTSATHQSPTIWIALALASIVVTVLIAIVAWRKRTRSSPASLDEAAAAAMARRMGLSRRERATLWSLAKFDGQHTPLDLLVSVKKLTTAASKRAENLADDSAREELKDLCRALDVDVPALTTSGRRPQPTRTQPNLALQARSGSPARPSAPMVVTPRLIDRRG